MSPGPGRLLVCLGEDPVVVGSLVVNPAPRRRAGVSATFSYDQTWLARPGAYAIDPRLSLLGVTSTTPGLPGCFQDCSPDRWGRNLVEKRMRVRALREGATPRTITAVDFLVGVADLTRQGALRLRRAPTGNPGEPSGPFLDPENDIPKLIELPRLLAAADAVERDPDDQAAVKTLLDAGSGSLGGARPKASVSDGERLMIAKFPHREDAWDVMAWEATALDLAGAAGIGVPARRLTRVDGRAVLVLDRFDRDRRGRRLPYLSAMSLLARADGEVADYVDFCDAIVDDGAAPLADLELLWRRVAFAVAIHSTDDHLRNHGFTRAPGGWTFAPLFDVNPDPDPSSERVTGIDGARTMRDEALGLESLAQECRIGRERRRAIAGEVLAATATWPTVAAARGIAASEIARFRDTFEAGARVLDTIVDGRS